MDIPVHSMPSEIIFPNGCIYSIGRPDFSELEHGHVVLHIRSFSQLIGTHTHGACRISRDMMQVAGSGTQRFLDLEPL